MSRNLVFGLSGQVGEALLPLLDEAFGPVLAVSRQQHAARAGIEWQAGTLEAFGAAPPECTRVLSLGPLDAFVAWVQRTQPRVERIVALGSTGRVDKRESPDARERDEAQRLEQAEAALFEFGRRSGAAVTVLRPTLLYGNGRDRSLTPLMQRARRWRLLPWPRGAAGMRQPVHVEDVARAVLASVGATASYGRGFDLPGGEALRFDELVARCLVRQVPGARLLRLPDVLFAAALALAGLAGRGAGAKGWLWRARRDQIADSSAACAAFGFQPRSFEP